MPVLVQYVNGREKHDAWKLIGATLVDKHLDLDDIQESDLAGAIHCWKTSFDFDVDILGDEPVQQLDFIPEPNDVQKRVYAGFSEAKTLAEVNQMIGVPDAIHMQVHKCIWNQKDIKITNNKINCCIKSGLILS
jgi:hypothetical protein